MNGEFDSDLFTAALREDLPNADDEARVRARLATAGVLAGVGVIAPTATAAVSGAATAGVFSKMLALPLIVKFGATALLVGVAAVPVLRARSRAAMRIARAAPVSTSVPLLAFSVVTPSVTPRAVLTVAPAALGPAPIATTTSPEVVSPTARRSGQVTAVNVVSGAGVAPTGTRAVRSFAAETPEDEGTLRAETALMEQALAALERGDWAVAREKLTEHARAFPDGHLAPERERALERVREKETTP